MSLENSQQRRPGIWERIIGYLPGFEGYVDRRARRDNEARFRQRLADRLSKGAPAIEAHARRLVDAGQIDELPGWESLRHRVRQLTQRLQAETRERQQFWEAAHIESRRLDDLYDREATLMDDIESFVDSTDKLVDEKRPATQVLAELNQQLSKVTQSYDERESLIASLPE